MTTLEAVTQLVDALESARATGALAQDTESGAWFTFRLSPEEYAVAPGEDDSDVDEVDGKTYPSKRVYTSSDDEYVIEVVPAE